MLDDYTPGSIPKRRFENAAVYEIRYTSWQLLERATSIWAIYEALVNFLRHLGGGLESHNVSFRLELIGNDPGLQRSEVSSVKYSLIN